MPKWTKKHSPSVTIAFLIFDQFSNLCLANCLEPLRATNSLSLRTTFEWQILTPTGDPVHSSSGMQVLPHAPLSALKSCDYLYVVASYHHERLDTPDMRRSLQRAARNARTVVGLDAGPWLLASAGLLDGRRATVHWDILDAFTERFLEVEAEQARFIRDETMITCAGAMSALDLTLGLISDHLGTSMRLDVESMFIHGDPPVDDGSGRQSVTDPLVRRALALMRDNIEQPLALPVLASRLSCQSRTLDRRFRAGLGAPPGTVYRHLRLSSARKMLEGTNLSVSEISLRCGYESSAALARAIGRHYDTTPSDLRQGG